MKEKQKIKLEQKLKKNGFIKNSDTLLDAVQASYKKKSIGKMGEWKPGWIYFTQDSMLCSAGLLGEKITIPYADIKSIGKCNQFIFPIGIVITYNSPNNNKIETEYFSVSKRGIWLDFISKKSGVSVI